MALFAELLDDLDDDDEDGDTEVEVDDNEMWGGRWRTSGLPGTWVLG
jgi:hypothetical protein